ncbi:sporulation integral membrane protein YtvI [Syntrophomonas erecta]
MEPDLEKNLKILVKVTILVLALVAIYLLFFYVLPIIGNMLTALPVLFLPFIIAIILAIIIEPVVVFFETKIRLKRAWAVITSLVLVVGGFIYLVSIIFSKIIRELSEIYPQIARYSDQIISRFIDAMGDLRISYLQMNLPPQMETTIQNNMERGTEVLRNVADSILNSLIGFFTSLPNTFILILIATVATYFIIKDRALLKTFILQFIPGSARSKTRKVFAELFRALLGFLKAYSILISITAIITIIALKILGVKYILTIGIIVGLLDILPILGPGALFVPWIIWEFINGDTRLGISLLVIYVFISVTRQFLEPKIIGENIGLHPLATLISLYLGLQLGGIMGMIMGPVLVVIIMASYRAGVFESFHWRKIK